ncbi:hypothetical protein ACFWN1_25970 [Streptomyces sp. NPDC058459]|uniref:hypothetical protein n=1 Tax=Streptomyces sp. NPDC058459 TaxID=3346508 RepID=UPI00365A0140
MAKNKNRKQTGPKNRASQAEQSQRSHEQAAEAPETTAQVAGGQPDHTQRQNKRFGHN